MNKALFASAATTLAMLLVACGTKDEATQNQALSANQAGLVAEDLSNPFAQAEMQMNERMIAAVGADVGDSWVRKMIEHHQGAIDMSRIVQQHNPKPDVAAMARTTIDKQGQEIEDLHKLSKQGPPNPQSGEVFAPAIARMHGAMMAATGADVSESFLRKMLEHHRGGVAISDIALQNGVGGAVRQQVQKTRAEQHKEAQMVEAMLRGETMSHAIEQAVAGPAAPAKREPAPAETERAVTKAAPPPPTAKPAPAPAPEPAPSPPTCLPEHRAAGHC